KRLENRRQIASGRRPQSSWATDRGSGGRRAGWCSRPALREALVLLWTPLNPPARCLYLDFPAGRKLTIFSPSLISATSLGRGTLSICMYQRSTSSVKDSIPFSRWLGPGLMVG